MAINEDKWNKLWVDSFAEEYGLGELDIIYRDGKAYSITNDHEPDWIDDWYEWCDVPLVINGEEV